MKVNFTVRWKKFGTRVKGTLEGDKEILGIITQRIQDTIPDGLIHCIWATKTKKESDDT